MFGDDKHWTMLAVELRVQNAMTKSCDGEHYNVTFRIEFDIGERTGVRDVSQGFGMWR